MVLPAFAKTKYPEPTSGFFVNDFANCITAEDEKKMQALGEQLYKQTKAQVVVVTVESLDGKEIEDYSIGLAREWGIGDKDDDSGVLLLLSTNDRQIRIEVGKGLEGKLTDGKTGNIIDKYAKPYLSSNDFSRGLYEGYNILVQEVYSEFGVEGYTGVSEDYDTENSKSKTSIISTIIFIILIVVVISAKGGRGGRGRGVFIAPMFFGGGRGSNSSNDDFSGGGFGGGFGGGGFGGGGGGFGGGGSSSRF